MLTEKQVNEIREHLERANNPIFYYDNDADGLCSFLLFRRFLGRGKGVAVRSYPDLNVSYARRASELGADYVFVLDKPVISKEFVLEINKLGLPIVWIDHHKVEESEIVKGEHMFVFNISNKGEGEPVTYWAYKICNRNEDMWLAIMGCIADHYLPDFSSEFGEKFPDLWKSNIKKPFEAYYGTEIGRIARAIGYGLKDSITNVVSFQRFLISVGGPLEVLEESKGNRAFLSKYKEVEVKKKDLMERAKLQVYGNLIFFVYSGDLSISADIANELSYFYPEKRICVGYKSQGIVNFSMRGKDIRIIFENVAEKLEGASGGGHDEAIGARIKTPDIDKFRDLLMEEVNL